MLHLSDLHTKTHAFQGQNEDNSGPCLRAGSVSTAFPWESGTLKQGRWRQFAVPEAIRQRPNDIAIGPGVHNCVNMKAGDRGRPAQFDTGFILWI